jgi:hypothetical protein
MFTDMFKEVFSNKLDVIVIILGACLFFVVAIAVKIQTNKERKKPIETHTASVEREMRADGDSGAYRYSLNFIMYYDDAFHKVTLTNVNSDLFFAVSDGAVGQLTHQGTIFHKFEYDGMVIEWRKTRYVLKEKEQ